jgi:hypothetical protein
MKKRGRPRKTAPPGEELKKRLVRCLGLGKEHSFNSPDPTRIRLCWRCKALVQGIGGQTAGTKCDRRRKGYGEYGA